MFILASVLMNLIQAVSLILAAAVAGLMAFLYAKARLRERQGYIYDPDTATVEPSRTGMEQRAKSADEIVQIRARIEALMEPQQMTAETQNQHLGQKLDEIRTHMGQQDTNMDGIKGELCDEIRRRDSELGELRQQLATALDAFWKSMPALSEGNGADDARALPPALPNGGEAEHDATEPDTILSETPSYEHADADMVESEPADDIPVEAAFTLEEPEPASITPIEPEPESADSMPEPAETTFAHIEPEQEAADFAPEPDEEMFAPAEPEADDFPEPDEATFAPIEPEPATFAFVETEPEATDFVAEPAEATFAPIEPESASFVPIEPETETADSIPEPAEATFVLTEPELASFTPIEPEPETADSMPEPSEATFAPVQFEPAPATFNPVPPLPEPVAFSPEDGEPETSTPAPVEPDAATFAPIASAPEPVAEKSEEMEAETAGIVASEPAPEPAATAPAVPQEEPVGDDAPMSDIPDAPGVAPPAAEEAIWTNAAAWTEPAQANAPAAPSEPASPPAQPPADPSGAENPAPTAPVIEQMVISPSGDSISVEPPRDVQNEPADATPTSGAILDAASRHTGEPTFEAPQPSAPAQPPTSPQPAQESVSQQGPEPAQPGEPTREDRPPAASENGTASLDVPRDDLTVISSITEETQQKLYDIGVTKLDEMAGWCRSDARRVGGQVDISEETIMHQWIFEAQSVLFDSFQDNMARQQELRRAL